MATRRITILAAVSGLAASAIQAHAIDLGQPEVIKGATELRNVNTMAWDRGNGGSGLHLHEFHLGYGVSEELALKAILTLEGGDGQSTDLSLGAIEGTYELIDIEKSGFGLAWYTIVDVAIADDAGNDVVFGPILKFRAGKLDFVSNTYAVQSFGDGRVPALDFVYAWQAAYEIDKHFRVGIEGDGGLYHHFHNELSCDEVHRIGPVIFSEFHVGQHVVTMDLGLQFGLTDPAPDTEAKVIFGTVF